MTLDDRGLPRSTPGRALVLNDGSLPGLVATAIASEETVRRESLGRLEAPVVLALGPRAGAAVKRQSDAYGAVLDDASPPDDDLSDAGVHRSGLLLRAGQVALRHRCRRVIWPVLDGTATEPASVEVIGRELDRALLAGRLVSLDAGHAGLPEVVIETPFIDLTDEQLADLAMELGAPIQTCWWWAAADGVAERARWGRVLPAAMSSGR